MKTFSFKSETILKVSKDDELLVCKSEGQVKALNLTCACDIIYNTLSDNTIITEIKEVT